MIFNKGMDYQRQKIIREDGSYYNLIEMKVKDASSIDFSKVENTDRQQKLFDTAHIRLLKAAERGVEKPTVIVWSAFDHQISAASYFPGILARAAEEYLSLNALITERLRALIKSKNYLIRKKRLRVKNTDSETAAAAAKIIALLEKEKRLKIYQTESNLSDQEIYNSLDYRRDLIAVGEIAFASDYSRQHNYPLCFNCSYFLLEEADWESKYSLLGDHYGLLINDGAIISPPIYNRSALLKTENNNWELKKVFLTDLTIQIQNKKWDLSKFKVNQKSDFSIYTRHYGVKDKKKVLGITPEAADKVELVIINNVIVGVKKGGATEISQNAFILSIPAEKFSFNSPLQNKVQYSFNNDKQYRSAVQTGPLLVKEGELRLNNSTLKEEDFFGQSSEEVRGQFERVVPTDYADDIDQTRAARMVAGINAQNEFCLLAVESVNTGMEAGAESSGATLQEMAEWAHKRNYKYALNLDGGGSANIQYLYGSLFKTADRRGLPGVVYERMIPTVGFISKI
jgi:hypothetical protein